jgi:hypothetical protein
MLILFYFSISKPANAFNRGIAPVNGGAGSNLVLIAAGV